jgi:hypothetical protein
MPLVNELVIGLPDKDKFNNSKPKDDGQFATYVTNPTLPALVEIALATPGIAPTNFPRTDLVTTFLTGISGVNQPKAFSAARRRASLPRCCASTRRSRRRRKRRRTASACSADCSAPRRRTSPAIRTAAAERRRRRHLADRGDGRPVRRQRQRRHLQARRACKPSAAPLGTAAFGLHDGVDQAGAKVKAAGPLLPTFPYLGTPLPGAK